VLIAQFEGGLRGGVMGGAVMAQRHPRRGAGGAGSGGAKDFRPGSQWRGGEEEADKRGPRVTEGRESRRCGRKA
jgi:hypothetical protein